MSKEELRAEVLKLIAGYSGGEPEELLNKIKKIMYGHSNVS